jgi:hypothetical protein
MTDSSCMDSSSPTKCYSLIDRLIKVAAGGDIDPVLMADRFKLP